MSSPLRSSAIPLDFVAAELAAFPVASVDALRLAVTDLDPTLRHEGTRQLWRAAEAKLIAGRAGISLDELLLIRDSVWFPGIQAPAGWSVTHVGEPILRKVSLLRYVHSLADSLLMVRGYDAIPRPLYFHGTAGPDDAAIARRRWMWHEVAIPPDLLLASLEARYPTQPSPTLKLCTIGQPLVALLGKETFAETHVHLGAALDFEMVWVAAMLMVMQDGASEAALASPGADMDEGKGLAKWLLRAAIARWNIACFLATRQPQETWAEFLGSERFQVGIVALQPTDRWSLRLEIDSFRSGCDSSAQGALSFGELRVLYRQIAHAQGRWLQPPLSGTVTAGAAPPHLGAGDPVGWLMGWHPGHGAWPERLLMRKALAHAAAHPDDAEFAAVLWQVVRVRGLMYRHVVMRPTSRGLQQFVRFFGRTSGIKKFVHLGTQLESALDKAGGDYGLISLELRRTPDEKVSELRKFVDGVRTWAEQKRATVAHHRALEVGLVLHFSRLRSKSWSNGISAAGEVDAIDSEVLRGDTPLRFRQIYAEAWRMACALINYLSDRPEVLRIWRGIDCCTDEQGVPAWVLQPLFRWVRAAAERAAPRAGLRSVAHPIHATVHAGEDFIHLLSGLRQIHESVRAFELREGDRIGHGLALGIDPASHCGNAGRIAMAREQRLFDLLWLIRFVGDREPVFSLQDEAVKLGREMFPESFTAHELITWQRLDRLYERLWREHGEVLVESQPIHPLFARRALADDELFRSWMCQLPVHMQARQPIWVDPAADVRFVIAAQDKLREQIARIGLTIEVNPTSNLLIGDLGDLAGHPLWRLRSPIVNADTRVPLSVSVGTDDPLIIASTLPVEYQRLADAMASIGLSEEQRRQWISRTIHAGLESRFTLRVP